MNYSSTVPEKHKSWPVKGGPFRIFNIHSVAKHQQIQVGPFGIFQHPFCRKTSKARPFEEKKFSKKSLTMPKKTEGDSLVSLGTVCYAEKQEKPFWFSSLGQMLQFDTIKFCRTILVSSCGLKKSHYNSRVSLYEAPTKNYSAIQLFHNVSD